MFERLRDFWKRLRLDERGITTSEFWLSGVAIVSTASGFITGNKAIIVGALVAVYTISRGLTKIR